MNLNDITTKNESPEVLVQGIGTYTLDQVKRNIQGKVHDLAKRVDALVAGGDQSDWTRIGAHLRSGALQAFIEAAAKATREEMEQQSNQRE